MEYPGSEEEFSMLYDDKLELLDEEQYAFNKLQNSLNKPTCSSASIELDPFQQSDDEKGSSSEGAGIQRTVDDLLADIAHKEEEDTEEDAVEDDNSDDVPLIHLIRKWHSDSMGSVPSQQSDNETLKLLDFNQGSSSGGRGIKRPVDDLLADIAHKEDEDAEKGGVEEDDSDNVPLIHLIRKWRSDSIRLVPSLQSDNVTPKPLDFNQGSSSGGRGIKRPVDDLLADIAHKEDKDAEKGAVEEDDSDNVPLIHLIKKWRSDPMGPGPSQQSDSETLKPLDFNQSTEKGNSPY